LLVFLLFFSCFSKRISWVCCAWYNENVSGARGRQMIVLRAIVYFAGLVRFFLLSCDVLSFRMVVAPSYYEWSCGPRSFLRPGRAVVVSPEPADSNSVSRSYQALSFLLHCHCHAGSCMASGLCAFFYGRYVAASVCAPRLLRAEDGCLVLLTFRSIFPIVGTHRYLAREDETSRYGQTSNTGEPS
jgi:hypothetical protein